MKQAVLLALHGTVENLDDLPAFVTNIRRGHAPPPELIAELRRRYTAIGGRSPLNETSARLAEKLEARIGVPVRMANRLWKPFMKDVLAELGAERAVVLPLAQHSAPIYVEDAQRAASELPTRPEVVGVPNWGQTPALLDLFARRIHEHATTLAGREHDSALVLSAHSLPKAIVDAGDPYEREVRAAATAVAERVRDVFPNTLVAFQSQGMSAGPGNRPMPWLGPDLLATLDEAARCKFHHVVFAPIGFLADHVEILYDLDIEAKGWAKDRGLSYSRVRSLNDDDEFVSILAALVTPVLV